MSKSCVPVLQCAGVDYCWLVAQALYGTGKYKSALTLQGLIHAYALGVILWGTLGFAGWSTCVVYLVFGSIVTKIRKKEKEALGIAGASRNEPLPFPPLLFPPFPSICRYARRTSCQ